MEINESIQSQGIWALVISILLIGFFMTVPGCQAEAVKSYNDCVAKTSDGNKDRCTVGS